MNHRSFAPHLRVSAALLILTACGGQSPDCPSGSVRDPDSGRCLAVDGGSRDATTGDASVDSSADAMADAATDADMGDTGLADSAMPDADMGDADSPDACAPTLYYADTDMDGFGDPTSSMDACVAPAGFVEDSTDCDDTAMGVNPDAAEVCNGVDDNCDGTVDEGVATTYYADTDMDGFGDATASMDACAAPTGFVEDSTDCDDTDMGAHPGATEACDGVDDDCNGSVDDGLSVPSCALTAGVCAGAVQACGGASGWVACMGAASYGASYEDGAETSCDHLDNDCDGSTDEGTRTQFYADCDGDGARDAAVRRGACDAAEALAYFESHGHPGCMAALPASAPEDCDDANGGAFPGGVEVCNGVDDNCAGGIDEGVKTSFYPDCDGDGHGDGAGTTVDTCTAAEAATEFGATCMSAVSTNHDDCADQDADAHPGQTLYFTSGISGTRNGTTDAYDYNCDGSTNGQFTSFGSCSAGTIFRAGWAGSSLPSCGGSASWIRRDPFNVLGCSTGTQTQACH